MLRFLLLIAAIHFLPAMLKAQTTLPDFREVNQKDRYFKMMINEFKVSDQEMTRIETQISKAAKSLTDAHRDLQKNPVGLAERLKDIASHFNHQLKGIIGEARYKTYCEKYPELSTKYLKP